MINYFCVVVSDFSPSKQGNIKGSEDGGHDAAKLTQLFPHVEFSLAVAV